MAYTLCALVARQPVGVVLQAETGLGAVELAQGFWLMPLGRTARLELGGPAGIEDLARHASLAGPVGYLEAEFFGGAGTQAAVAWRDDTVIAGPLRLELGGLGRAGGDIAQWPFNQVLRRLGVLRRDAIDEFDAVGLNRHRSTDDWVKIAAR